MGLVEFWRMAWPDQQGEGLVTKKEFRERMRELANSDEAIAYLSSIVKREHKWEKHSPAEGRFVPCPPSDDLWKWGMDFVADRGIGKPAQAICNVDEEGKSIPYSIVVKIENPNG